MSIQVSSKTTLQHQEGAKFIALRRSKLLLPMHLPPTIAFAMVQTQVWLGAASVLRSMQAAKCVQSPLSKHGPETS